jgi:hypothetical protein
MIFRIHVFLSVAAQCRESFMMKDSPQVFSDSGGLEFFKMKPLIQ